MRSYGRFYWLWCCFGVLLVSCGNTITATSTRVPLLTFTIPTLTPTAILRLMRTPRPSGTLALTTAPTPFPLLAASPDCYETPVGSMWCMGVVKNTLSFAVNNVILQMYLVNTKGNVLAEKQVSLAQVLVMPGESAPYGALFEAIPEKTAGAVVVLTSANKGDGDYKILTVSDLQHETREGSVIVTGKIDRGAVGSNQNAANQNTTIQSIRVIVTLSDQRGRVIGFRQVQLPIDTHLAGDFSLPFHVEVSPQALTTGNLEAVQIKVAAEGLSR